MTIDMGKLADRAIGQQVRVYIDGVEITNRCFYASEEDGIARCYIMVSYGESQRLRMLHSATPKPKPNAYLHGGVWAEQLSGFVELKKVA